jgi:phenylalanyl-tRNA synthetase beta chain
MVCALAERGGQIEKVVIRPKNSITPDLNERKMELNMKEVNSTLGLELKNDDIIKLLGMSRFDVGFEKSNFICKYMPYRQDIVDTRDLIEDIAISYNYNKFPITKLEIATRGKNSKEHLFEEKVARTLIGIGAQEIATFTLTNKEKLFKKMKIKPAEVAEIANAVSENYSCLRNSLLPSLLEFLFKNKDKEFPQKIFEIGNCVNIEARKAIDRLKTGFAISHAKTNFTEIRQSAEFLLKNLGILNIKIERFSNERFIEGRCGKIFADKKEIGILGEINPAVLENWGLNTPVSAFEIDVTELI